MAEYTTKEIAELLGVSKPTVQKAINTLAVKPERKDNTNRAFYSYANTVAIIQKIRPSFEEFEKLAVGAKSPNELPNEAQSTAKPPDFAQNSANQTAKPQSEELELLKETIGIIKEQLEEKKQIIEAQQRTIDTLSDRLKEANQLIKGQQYITAADKTTELLEADSKRSQQQEEPPIIIGEADAEVEDSPSSWTPQDKSKEEQEPEPQKKSFLQRIFGI